MTKQDIFIGREKELQIIDSLVFDSPENRHFIGVRGDGGVGKTWLFREIYRRYQSDPRVIPIRIEFDQVGYQTLQIFSHNLFSQLTDYISERNIKAYRAHLTDFEQWARHEPDERKILQAEKQIFFEVVDLIVRSTKGKRLLYLADTSEAVSEEYLIRVATYGAAHKNTVVITAGRPTRAVLGSDQVFYEVYNGWVLHFLTLKPFSSNEVREYLQRTLSVNLTDELPEKIYLLTGGNPVLMSMASAWIKRNMLALPDSIDLASEELQEIDWEDLADYRQWFEIELIQGIESLPEPIYQTILCSAFLNRRFNSGILGLVLDIQDDELISIVETLKNLDFFRKSISGEIGLLHDEVQRLIDNYIWPKYDPDKKYRYHLAQKVISGYYLQEIERLNKVVHDLTSNLFNLPPIPAEEMLRQELQVECLYYHFCLDDRAGIDYLRHLLVEAEASHYQYIYQQAIREAYRSFKDIFNLDDEFELEAHL